MNKKNGFAFIFTIILILLFMLILLTFFLIATNDLIMSKKIVNSITAYYLADAGISDAFMLIRNSASLTGPGTFDQSSNNYDIGTGYPGSYQVHIQYGTSPTYTITSTGTYRGSTKRLQLSINGASFSRWAYATNTEQIPVGVYPWWSGGLNPVALDSYWITGNIVEGPLNTNSHLFIAGSPVFNGHVSQHDPAISYWNGGPPRDNPNFAQGLTLNAPTITMPTPTTRDNILGASQQAGGLLLDGTDSNIDPVTKHANGSTSVTLNTDGTMNVTNLARGWNNINMAMPANGAIFVVNGDVKVQGVLNGQLTIGCDNNIYTPSSIIYHDTSPANPNPASTDLLGLVAQRNVIIPNSAPNTIEIDGNVVAPNGSFYLENCWTCPLKGNFVQFGGIMSNWSATVFGTFNGNGTLASGYNQLQFYDDRLLSQIPLWFSLAQDASNRVTYSKASFHEVPQ